MSSTSNEDAKNMALLFFMDHLMQKNGRRTIHDLSCQFGARGFSQEMREAVGATQEGLTDFLSQFPSLFVIEGDTVTMTGYGDLAMGGAKASPLLQTLSRDRNYEQEAVEFFEEKLRRFGPELQIKSLLGHRSQSAPEIRLVSGRHVKDFTDFLSHHPNNFVVENDRVRLRHMPEPIIASDNESDDLGVEPEGQAISPGVRAKLKALDFLKTTVEEVNQPQGPNGQTSPLAVDALYKRFCERFSHKVRQHVAANPKELLQFLKLNRNIFFIRSNKVSIVRNRPSLLIGGGDADDSPLSDRSVVADANAGVLSPASTPASDRSAASDGGAVAASSFRVSLVKSLAAAQSALGDLARCLTYGGGGDKRVDVTDDRRRTFNVPAFGVDAKWASVSDREFLSLLIIASGDGSKSYVFDAAHSSSIVLESGVKELLEAEDVVKVMHDSSKFCDHIWQQYGIAVKNVFDTQIANTVLQHHRTGKPLHEIKPIPFTMLQRIYHPQSLLYSESSVSHSSDTVTNWSIRPLSDETLQRCAEEARYLMPFIYTTMNNSLKPDTRALFKRLCQEATGSHDGSIGANFANSSANENRFEHNAMPYNSNQFISTYKRRNNVTFNGQSASAESAQNVSPCCACKCHRPSILSGNTYLADQQNYSKTRSSSRDVSCQTVASGDNCILPVFVDTV